MIPDKTYTILVVAWIGLAVILFPVLLQITVPYGRHSSKNWGPMISNRLGWSLMELPALLIFSFLMLQYGDLRNIPVIAASILWIVHYFHRAVLFPFRIRTYGKQMPLVILLFAFVFNTINGYINGRWLTYLNSDHAMTGITTLRVTSGVIIFLFGFIINQYHDRILIRLRQKDRNGYQIPFGGLFRFVSCPNFLGEIIEWGGYALLAWGLPSLSFFIWTLVNLIPRALNHHRWYKNLFPDYPSQRKAVIPFLL
jgi:hypothetical protein